MIARYELERLLARAFTPKYWQWCQLRVCMQRVDVVCVCEFETK